MTAASTTATGRRGGLSLLGIGAAACVACCIGPLVAFLSGLGVLAVLSTPIAGALGLAVAVVALTSALLVRRRRRPTCAATDEPVAIADPVRR